MMNQSDKVAIVTGSNKGIGLSMVKLLCQQSSSSFVVYLTARDEERGLRAAEELKKAYHISPRFHQLDVDSLTSIKAMKDYLAREHPNGIDLLINNAGCCPPVRSQSPSDDENIGFRFNAENVKKTIRTNFVGTLNVCLEFSSILKKDARIVNISSGMASCIYRYFSPQLQSLLNNCSNVDDLSGLMELFMNSDPNDYQKIGWITKPPDYVISPDGFCVGDLLSYGVSKFGIIVLSKLLQQKFDAAKPSMNIVVNACCPGNVCTDLNPFGKKSPDEGADTPLYLATCLKFGKENASDNREMLNSGQFFADREIQDPFTYRPPWPVI